MQQICTCNFAVRVLDREKVSRGAEQQCGLCCICYCVWGRIGSAESSAWTVKRVYFSWCEFAGRPQKACRLALEPEAFQPHGSKTSLANSPSAPGVASSVSLWLSKTHEAEFADSVPVVLNRIAHASVDELLACVLVSNCRGVDISSFDLAAIPRCPAMIQYYSTNFQGSSHRLRAQHIASFASS